MAPKITEIKIAEVNACTNRQHELVLHVSFNDEGKTVLEGKGTTFNPGIDYVKHLMCINKSVYEGDDKYLRNKAVAEIMRAVRSDYEDILELNDNTPSTAEIDDITDFTYDLVNEKLADTTQVLMLEEDPDLS